MSDITFREKTKIESLLGMKSGYVLDFSDRSFREFVSETTGIDITDQKFNYSSGSKANRLRAFMSSESNYIVGVLLESLIHHSMSGYKPGESIPNELYDEFQECLKISKRLKDEASTDIVAALQPNNEDKDFKLLGKLIKESIIKNEPEAALDRLHTFITKYLRQLCLNYSIAFTQETPTHSLMGLYVKNLISKGLVESEMSIKILKHSISLLDAFNEIRNNRSFAHDNKILNYDESILIFNSVSQTISFIQSLENKINNKPEIPPEEAISDLPF